MRNVSMYVWVCGHVHRSMWYDGYVTVYMYIYTFMDVTTF